MNNQEIFDKVLTHIRTQKKPASDSQGDCYYRAADGSMCAAGCLIKDEHYNPEMENSDTTHHLVANALIYSGVDVSNERTGLLLLDLQKAHDRSATAFREQGKRFMDEYETRMIQVAEDFSLKYTPPVTEGEVSL